MPQYKVVIGVATVQNSRQVVQPVDGQQQTQIEVEVTAADPDEAFNIVQTNLQTLLSQPPPA